MSPVLCSDLTDSVARRAMVSDIGTADGMAPNVNEIFVAILAKVGMTIVEALAVRLMWTLWTAYARSQQRATTA